MQRFGISIEARIKWMGVWQQLVYLVFSIFLNNRRNNRRKGCAFDKIEVAGDSSCPSRCVIVIDDALF